MLREIRPAKQFPDDYFRRIFHDENLTLYIWYKADQSIYGFQLCHDTEDEHRALTWKEDQGFSHAQIDEGDSNPFFNRTPILIPCPTSFDSTKLFEIFSSSAQFVPATESAFVEQKLAENVQFQKPPSFALPVIKRSFTLCFPSESDDSD